MELKFTQSTRKYAQVLPALFLAAVICNVFAALDWLHLLPAALVGVILPLIPQTKRRQVQDVLWGFLAAWLLLRFASILDGMKLLANRMFALSQQTQSYEYDYFTTSGESPVEAVLWLSILAGTLCSLWGNRVNGVLCGGWMLAMAYFGVTPGAVWLASLMLAAFWSALPGQQRWFHGVLVAVLLCVIALTVTRITPEPMKGISALDDRLRDALAAAPVAYEQTPVPTEVPEPEAVPQPETELEQPDHGVQRIAVNVLFLLLAALTLALLFIPAVIKDRAEKRRQRSRAGLRDPDNAAAIRAMYLYARKWLALSEFAPEIPAEIHAIFQEAAYSDHAMTEQQRETMRSFLVETAAAVWQASGWKQRLDIQYRIGL